MYSEQTANRIAEKLDMVCERVRRKTEGFYLSNWKDAGIINESELFLQNYVYTYNMQYVIIYIIYNYIYMDRS